MFGIFEHHINRFIFQYNLSQGDQISVMKLSIELPMSMTQTVIEESAHHDLSRTTLTDPSVSLDIPFLVRFELFDGEHIPFFRTQISGAHTHFRIV